MNKQEWETQLPWLQATIPYMVGCSTSLLGTPNQKGTWNPSLLFTLGPTAAYQALGKTTVLVQPFVAVLLVR